MSDILLSGSDLLLMFPDLLASVAACSLSEVVFLLSKLQPIHSLLPVVHQDTLSFVLHSPKLSRPLAQS